MFGMFRMHKRRSACVDLKKELKKGVEDRCKQLDDFIVQKQVEIDRCIRKMKNIELACECTGLYFEYQDLPRCPFDCLSIFNQTLHSIIIQKMKNQIKKCKNEKSSLQLVLKKYQ